MKKSCGNCFRLRALIPVIRGRICYEQVKKVWCDANVPLPSNTTDLSKIARSGAFVQRAKTCPFWEGEEGEE